MPVTAGFNGAAVSQPRKCGGSNPRVALLQWLQWGRGLSTAEIYMRASCRRRSRRLQWGRGLSTAEMTPSSSLLGLLEVASMGPRSLNRGNAAARIAQIMRRRLQWGRGLSTAEMLREIDYMVQLQRLASMGPRSLNRGNDSTC